MFIAIALLFDLLIFGFLLTYFFRLRLFFEERLATGLLLALVLMGFLMLLLGYFFGLGLVNLGIFVVLINSFSLFNLNHNLISKITDDLLDFKKRIKDSNWIIFHIFNSFFVVLFGFLATQLMTFKNGAFFVQPEHAYGDIHQHLGIITSFAYGNNFPPQSSILSGTKISYPFLVDFISAIFVNPLSLRLDQAVAVTGGLLMALLIFILSFFVIRVTKSRLSAILVLFLFFFSGGLGFIYFFADFQKSGGVDFLYFITHLHRDYTALKDLNYYWINVVLMMLLPQRSFLLGLPFTLVILSIFWDLSEHFDVRKLALGVFLTSLLPIVHAYSLVALSPFLIWLTILALIKNKQRIGVIFLIGLIGFLLMLLLSNVYLGQSGTVQNFFKVQIGWLVQHENIWQFYLKNFGLILIMIPLSLYLGFEAKRKLFWFVIISQLWFILPSLFVFQPWDYDNNKLFIYWFLFSATIVAWVFRQCLHSNKSYLIASVITLVFLMTFSGMLDISRLVSPVGTSYEIYSPEAIKLSEFVIKETPQKAVFLSTDKFDNPVVALSGRSTVVGYTAWLWSYGLDFSQRAADISKMFKGEGPELFEKYDITNVVIFPDANISTTNIGYFDSNFKLIYNQDGYRVYAI